VAGRLTLAGVASVVAALAAAVVLAGCGGSGSSGSSKVSATAYATALCKAVGPFERDIYSRQSALKIADVRSAAQGKAALSGFLSALAADTARAKRQMTGAGVPDVSGGSKIAATLVAMFARLQSAMDSAATQAAKLPTASSKAFRSAAVGLTKDVQNSVGDLGSGLGSARSGALEKASRKVAACQSLN
jgi:hypothetical protein